MTYLIEQTTVVSFIIITGVSVSQCNTTYNRPTVEDRAYRVFTVPKGVKIAIRRLPILVF